MLKEMKRKQDYELRFAISWSSVLCVRVCARLTQLDGSCSVVHVDTGQLAGSPGVTLKTDSLTGAATMFPEDDTAHLWVDAADGVVPAAGESETFANWDIEGGVLSLIVLVVENVNLSNSGTGFQLLLVFFSVHFDDGLLLELLSLKVVGEV